MNKIISLLIYGFVFFLMLSCNKCKEGDPTIQISNNGKGKASIEIKDASGQSHTIPDLSKDAITKKENYPKGNINFSYQIGNTDTMEIIFLNYCTDYNISINSDHELIIFSKKRK